MASHSPKQRPPNVGWSANSLAPKASRIGLISSKMAEPVASPADRGLRRPKALKALRL
jgi:hypothetical protein